MGYFQAAAATFAISLAVFAFLRWKFPQSTHKLTWKRMAVANVIIGGAGIFSAVLDNQRFLQEVQYNTYKDSYVGATIGLKAWNTSMLWCDIPYDHELSDEEISTLRKERFVPDNVNAINRDHKVLCDWHNKISVYLSNFRFEEWPEIDMVNFATPALETHNFDDWVNGMIYTINHYDSHRRGILNLKESAEKSLLQVIFSFFAPFMLCIAIAFKIVEEAFK